MVNFNSGQGRKLNSYSVMMLHVYGGGKERIKRMSFGVRDPTYYSS